MPVQLQYQRSGPRRFELRDDKLHLLVCPFFQRGIYTLLGNGDGTFQMAQLSNGSGDEVWPAVGDFNNDGQVDVALTSVFDDQFSILLGKGDGIV